MVYNNHVLLSAFIEELNAICNEIKVSLDGSDPLSIKITHSKKTLDTDLPVGYHIINLRGGGTPIGIWAIPKDRSRACWCLVKKRKDEIEDLSCSDEFEFFRQSMHGYKEINFLCTRDLTPGLMKDLAVFWASSHGIVSTLQFLAKVDLS